MTKTSIQSLNHATGSFIPLAALSTYATKVCEGIFGRAPRLRPKCQQESKGIKLQLLLYVGGMARRDYASDLHRRVTVWVAQG